MACLLSSNISKSYNRHTICHLDGMNELHLGHQCVSGAWCAKRLSAAFLVHTGYRDIPVGSRLMGKPPEVAVDFLKPRIKCKLSACLDHVDWKKKVE